MSEHTPIRVRLTVDSHLSYQVRRLLRTGLYGGDEREVILSLVRDAVLKVLGTPLLPHERSST